MDTDDINDYLSEEHGFGTAGTLGGVACVGVFSSSSQVEDAAGAITTAPSWTVSAAAAVGAVPGTVAVINGISYLVRQAAAQPPDGALVSLVLARA
jgi:hypothetical protein